MNENNEADLGYYKFEKSDDSFQAYRWLEARLAENPNSDTAVICSYNFLQVDNFNLLKNIQLNKSCLLYTSPSPRDATLSRMPSSA